jgi:hypothetical protein
LKVASFRAKNPEKNVSRTCNKLICIDQILKIQIESSQLLSIARTEENKIFKKTHKIPSIIKHDLYYNLGCHVFLQHRIYRKHGKVIMKKGYPLS